MPSFASLSRCRRFAGLLVGAALIAASLSACGHRGLPSSPAAGIADAVGMPGADPAGYHRVFYDDFAGTSLDTSKWDAFSGRSGPAGVWRPANVTVGDGEMTLKGYRDPSSPATWVAAAVSSKPGLSQTYGRYDVRFEMDPGTAAYQILLWPSTPKAPAPYIGIGDDGSSSAAVLLNYVDKQGAASLVSDPVRVALGTWHTISIVWAPGRLSATVDHTKPVTITDVNVPSVPMNLQLKTGIVPCPTGGTGCWPRSEVDLHVAWVVGFAPGPEPSDGTASVPADPNVAGPMPTSTPAGYRQVFSDDFPGATLDPHWYAYTTRPRGDAAGIWAPSHVKIVGHQLVLSAYRDTAFGNAWVTGGVSSRPALSQVYGKYLVRMRVDPGVGVPYTALLWPTDNSGPPEMDFAEDRGGNRQVMIASTHFRSGSDLTGSYSVDMTQWHTVGIEWEPAEVRYTIDGTIWKTVVAPVSDVPMVLDLQLQTWPCNSTNGETCPDATTPATVNMDVAWVVAYAPKN